MTDTRIIMIERVKQSIDILLEHNAHQWYPGYVSLRRQARIQSGNNTLDYGAIEPKWRDLGEFLAVPGGPPNKPFLRPFWSGTREQGQEWLNRNLAGSYAPSSWRGIQFKLAHELSDRRIGLKEEHAKIALEELLDNRPLPALPMAAFFLRNYSFLPSSDTDADILIRAFAYEFGYREGDEEEFLTLYDVEWGAADGDNWLIAAPSDRDGGFDVDD